MSIKFNKIDKQNYQGYKIKSQITNIKNEKMNKTTDVINTKKIIKVYYQQLQANTFHNLKEMDKFLESTNCLSLLEKKNRKPEGSYIY